MAVILATLFSSFSSARFLASAASESLGLVAMLKFVLLKTVIALEVLMPIALYVAVVMGLGRLYRDQEISVLRSAGVSENRALFAVLIVAIPVGIASGVLSIFVRPWAYEESYMLNAQAEAELNIDRFQAGRFYGSEGKGRVVFVQAKDDSGKQMQNVFHYIHKSGSSEIILAKEARPAGAQTRRAPANTFRRRVYLQAHAFGGERTRWSNLKNWFITPTAGMCWTINARQLLPRR